MFENKVVHFMFLPANLLKINFVKFINKYFPKEDNYFIFYNNIDNFKVGKEYSDIENENTSILIFESESDIELVGSIIKKSKKTIFHSLYVPEEILLLLVSMKEELDKVYWIPWGVDIYPFTKDKLEYMSEIIKNIGGIYPLLNSEINIINQIYGMNYEKYKTVQYIIMGTDYINDLKFENQKEEKGSNKILVGHSGFKQDNHIHALQKLIKYKSEDIKIYLPLAYGDEEYINEVIDCAVKEFGDKAVPMLDMMKPEEYIDFLNEIDVAIFNVYTQNALGNIFTLLKLGKKVYLPQISFIWNDLVEEMGYKLNSIENIVNEEYSDFLSNDIVNIGINKEIVKSRFNIENIRKSWEDIL